MKNSQTISHIKQVGGNSRECGAVITAERQWVLPSQGLVAHVEIFRAGLI